MSTQSIIDNMKARAPRYIAQQSSVITVKGAHGEITLTRVDAMPESVSVEPAQDGVFVLAHSETGHDHVMDADPDVEMFREDAMTAWLRISGDTPKRLYQKRVVNPHAEQTYPPGIWRVVYSREKDLAGEVRRSMD